MRCLVVFVAVAVLGTGACSSEVPTVSDTTQDVSLERVALQVEGMT